MRRKQTAPSLDQVMAQQERLGDGQPELLGGLEVNHRLELISPPPIPWRGIARPLVACCERRMPATAAVAQAPWELTWWARPVPESRKFGTSAGKVHPGMGTERRMTS